jgi:UDP-2,4-diacetamido-2,4,6-trideoxy-beta-L-altropyranose hydrolase
MINKMMSSFKYSNYFVIRADANEDIGIGHVMRCLALSEWLSEHQIKPVLITKYSNSFIENKIIELNGKIIVLSESTNPSSNRYEHSKWLKGSEESDALQCIEAIEQERSTNGNIPPLFIIVDHYALAAPWEKILTIHAPIFVVDDLNDRKHYCTWLLDQTLGKKAINYSSLVSNNTKLFIGSKYALIRKEFTEATKKFQRSYPQRIVKVLVTLGGMDKPNNTSKVLSYLDSYILSNKKDIFITAVTCKSNPNLEYLQSEVKKNINISLLIDVHNMAELMMSHDVCIGAAGSTSWERCTMSLPTISIITAENQKTIAINLENAGAVINLGTMVNLNKERFLEKFNELLYENDLYNSLSQKSHLLCDGLGAERVVSEVLPYV